jgi:hypothetical protein
MKNMSTIAKRLANEIRAQDWSDAHSRADGSRHDRAIDREGGDQLDPDETEVVRMNVIWVVGQALAEDDPNFSIRDFAQAAGATNGLTALTESPQPRVCTTSVERVRSC